MQLEKLNTILNTASICYIVINPQGKIEHISLECIKLLGFSADNLKGGNISYILSEPERKTQEVINSLTTEGEKRMLSLKKHDGTTVKCAITSTKLEKSNDNLNKTYLIIEKTLNEESHAQEYEKDLLQILMDNIPDKIYFKDRESRFVRINIAQAELLGVNSPGEALGKNDFDYFSKEHAKLALEDETYILKTGKPIVNKEEKLVFEDRPTKWVSTTKVGVKNLNGEIDQIIGISRDITANKIAEQQVVKALEKATESDRLKSAFLANMSHEIRTPLNAIIGFAGLLNETNITEKKKNKFVDIIITSGNILLSLINDIIDIAKIEAGQLTIIEKPLDLNMFMKEIYTFFNEQYKRLDDNLELILKIPENNQNLIIYTDSNRLRQILSNLISNAYKFTDKGYIEFGYQYEEAECLLHFYVKDTGIGIPKKKINLIFERFGQVITDHTSKNKGTGLGLAISKGLIQLLGGKIEVNSELNKGSEFKFFIPAHFSDSKKIKRKQDKTDINSINWSGKHLLVVEDDYNSYNFLKEVLMPTQIEISHVDTGEKAIELCKNVGKFDLILMDLKLPGIDGYKTAKSIKEFDNKTPIIAQTAYALNEEEDKTLRFGFSAYISKPIILKDLLSMLSDLISKT